MSTPLSPSPTRSAYATLATNGQTPSDAAKYHHPSSACRDEESRHQMAEDEARLPAKPNDDPYYLEYPIPKVVESLRQGLRDSCNSAAIVAALLATIDAAIIVAIKTPVTPALAGSASSTAGSANATEILLILSYVGLILNASTTFSAHLLIDRLGKFSFMSKGVKPILTSSSVRSARRLLGCYSSSGKVWHILEFHRESSDTRIVKNARSNEMFLCRFLDTSRRFPCDLGSNPYIRMDL
ncbi:hypothetical protein FRB94_001913 [Tulasnella sp. JGI-2019a]|nr:hypothetical protein FRB93_004031 [Tulasnella sp. JGI-2019a]KAG9005023.1 hypothetical protein FRB94_001913 [Tulasnella sp. JGI-2019a]